MTTTGSGLHGWPQLRETWWVLVLGVVALALFVVGLLVRIRCGLGPCPPRDALFDLDSVGGLPRLFTTGLFLLVAVLAGTAAARSSGGGRFFWCVVSAAGVALSLAKLVSLNSLAEGADGTGRTLLAGVLITVVGLLVVRAIGVRAGVVGTRAVVVALAAYALAALGLDVVTGLVTAAQAQAGPYSAAGATFAEEFGEAITALALVVTVRWHVPPRG